MDETHLYQQIAESIRHEILSGALHPGDRLPSVREMTVRWSCTLGTVQRAYQELARQGLVTSRVGQGTHVVDHPVLPDETPMRRAALVHRAEAFLLEVLTAGYSAAEVEAALRQALDRWRAVSREPAPARPQVLRFAGSHDGFVTWLAAHFAEIAPGYDLQPSFSGSLGGLIALAEGQADLAGSHLWDHETGEYNAPFVRRLLPGRRVALLTLAHRRLGWILPPGNPQGFTGLADLARPGLRFVNRQPGSGTRVWLDGALRQARIAPDRIEGYGEVKITHSEVARAVAEGQASVGLGLESAAQELGLDFIPALRERYDLVIPAANLEQPAIAALQAWLSGPQARPALAALGGYDPAETGRLVWVES